MDIGSFRDRVSILSAPVEISDGHDGFIESDPVTVHHRWSAKVMQLSGRELERARQIDPRIALDVRLRYWRAYRDDFDGGRASLVWHPSSDSDEDRPLVIVTAPVETVPRQEVQVLCSEAA